MTTVYTFMIPIYGRLVASGKYSLDVEEGKKTVPQEYVQAVMEWLAENVKTL